jgi:hypothetical protein
MWCVKLDNGSQAEQRFILRCGTTDSGKNDCICLTIFADLPYVFWLSGAFGPAAGNVHAAISLRIGEARHLIQVL